MSRADIGGPATETVYSPAAGRREKSTVVLPDGERYSRAVSQNLGRGQFGEVATYRRDSDPSERIAVKYIDVASEHLASTLEAAQKEKQLFEEVYPEGAFELTHHVDKKMNRARIVMTMPLVPGITMSRFLGKYQDDNLKILKALRAHVLEMQRLQALGITHLDLHFENVLVEETDAGEIVVRFIDFGLATRFGEELPLIRGHFQPGSTAPPERYSREKIAHHATPKTDTYLLGVNLERIAKVRFDPGLIFKAKLHNPENRPDLAEILIEINQKLAEAQAVQDQIDTFRARARAPLTPQMLQLPKGLFQKPHYYPSTAWQEHAHNLVLLKFLRDSNLLGTYHDQPPPTIAVTAGSDAQQQLFTHAIAASLHQFFVGERQKIAAFNVGDGCRQAVQALLARQENYQAHALFRDDIAAAYQETHFEKLGALWTAYHLAKGTDDAPTERLIAVLKYVREKLHNKLSDDQQDKFFTRLIKYPALLDRLEAVVQYLKDDQHANWFWGPQTGTQHKTGAVKNESAMLMLESLITGDERNFEDKHRRAYNDHHFFSRKTSRLSRIAEDIRQQDQPGTEPMLKLRLL